MSVAEDADFEALVHPYRRELLAHGYQMLGSVADAEDAVQEALVRAWRAWDRYDPSRASVRTWIHVIVANTCRSALASRSHRVLPSGLGSPGTDVEQALVAAPEVSWVQPIPSSLLGKGTDDPAASIVARGQVRLAFVVALQTLSPRQRSVLILRDVLQFPASEVADMIGSTVAAVNSSLQRSRAALRRIDPDADGPRSSDERAAELVERYMDAFERADLRALRDLLVEEAVMEMPPVPLWFRGRDDFVGFVARAYRLRGTDWRVLPVDANGQMAFAAYVRAGHHYSPHSIQVLDVSPSGVTRNVVFFDQSIFPLFGLPDAVAGEGGIG